MKRGARAPLFVFLQITQQKVWFFIGFQTTTQQHTTTTHTNPLFNLTKEKL